MFDHSYLTFRDLMGEEDDSIHRESMEGRGRGGVGGGLRRS